MHRTRLLVLSLFGILPLDQSLDVAVTECERVYTPGIVGVPRHVIGAQRAGKLDVSQNSHDLEEVHNAFIRENLVEIVETAANVSHMDLVYFSPFAQVLNDRQDFCLRVLQPLARGSQAQLKSVVWAVHDRFVPFDGFNDRWRIPVVGALIPEWESRRIVRMARHSYVIFPGDRDHSFQEIGDSFPAVVRRYPARFSGWKIPPIVLQFESSIRGSSSSRSLPVSPDWNHRPVISDDLYANLRGLPDVSDDFVQLSIAFRTFP